MLGLYLDTVKIGGKIGSRLGILNELTMQKQLHNSVIKNVFCTKKGKTQQHQNKNANTNLLARYGNGKLDHSHQFLSEDA